MTLLKISTGECNLKELHEFKNNNNDGFKTFIATLTDWSLTVQSNNAVQSTKWCSVDSYIIVQIHCSGVF